MPDTARAQKTRLSITQLIPNLLTVAAICAGLTAIRFGFSGHYETAVKLILLAAILDGLDGRVARLIKAPSQIGAELDSLADFLNFGVAPVLILYSWGFDSFEKTGWIAVLCYAICCVLRLARFNVSSRQESEKSSGEFFVGVPSPAGAVLVMLPMVVSFVFPDLPLTPPAVIAAYICLVGFLMISHLPTYSFKNLSIQRGNVKFFLLGAVLLVAALLTYLWVTLAILSLVYILCIIWAIRAARLAKKQ